MKTIQQALTIIEEVKVLRKMEKKYWAERDYNDLQKVFIQQNKVDKLLNEF